VVAFFSVYQRRDRYYLRAKAAGYRARSAFKLLELAQRHRLFSRGDRVIDLGAWPGGWLQVAAQQVGPTGRVIGIDLQRVDPLPETNVQTVVGDIADAVAQQRVVELCGGRADVMLSDLAPKLTGVRDRDVARAQALVQCVLQFAASALRPGGKMVMKLFMSGELPPFVARLHTLFDDVRTTRPEATRKGSTEVYVIASRFRGAVPSS
jgi:23S rRNA (uridine2552-2'-O)-methyltransferase